MAAALGRAVRDARTRRCRRLAASTLGVRFFPVVNWAERGNFGDGNNSVPRFHLTWGTGKALVQAVWGAIEREERRAALEVRFGDARERADRLRTTAAWWAAGCFEDDYEVLGHERPC